MLARVGKHQGFNEEYIAIMVTLDQIYGVGHVVMNYLAAVSYVLFGIGSCAWNIENDL